MSLMMTAWASRWVVTPQGRGRSGEELGCSEEDPGHGQGTGRPARVALWSPVVSGKQ